MEGSEGTSSFFVLPVELFAEIFTTCINYYYEYGNSYDDYYQRKNYCINRVEEVSLGFSMRQQFNTFLTISEWLQFDSALTNKHMRKAYLSYLEGRKIFSPVQYLSSSSLRWISTRKLKLVSLYLTPHITKELYFHSIDLSALKMIVIPNHGKETLFDMLSTLNRCQHTIHFIGFEKSQNINISILKKLSKSFSHMHFLALYSCKYINDLSLTKLTQYQYGKQIIELNLSKCSITNEGLMPVVQSLKKLRSLDISYCRVSYAMVGRTLQSCAHSLAELAFDYLEVNYANVMDERTEILRLFQLFERFGKGLLMLSVRGNGQISDDCLAYCISHCSRLKQINLTECFRVTNLSLLKIGNFSHRLRALDVRDCFELSDEGVLAVLSGCRHLFDLALDGCHRLTPFILQEIAQRKKSQINFHVTHTQCPKL